uniref:FBA domain-containing protein n=2 Tax=Rhabditophanes sp. KR3021 TaxID=114890 RepID=A0AC35TZU4_9BILA
MFIKRPFNRNLIIDQIDGESQRGWKTTDLLGLTVFPCRALDTPPLEIHDDSYPVSKCASFCFSRLKQMIDFEEIGIDLDFIKKFKPSIIVSEVHNHRKPSSSGVYILCVDFLSGFVNEPKSMLMNKSDFVHQAEHFTSEAPKWVKVEQEFKDYSDDTRRINFCSGGASTTTANATVIITFDINKGDHFS